MFLVLVVCILISGISGGGDRVRLTDVSALTFQRGHYTAARRGISVPQLECVGGTASRFSEYHPSTAQCYNKGHDGRDVQWECKAELNKNVRLGRITVSCEGYSFPDDPYVLYGSCALQYELDFKDANRRTSSKDQKWYYNFQSVIQPRWMNSNMSPYLVLIGLLVLAFAIWFFCLRDTFGQIPGPVGFDEMPGPAPPSAPYPTEAPPPYDEGTHTPFSAFTEDFTTRQRPTSSSSPGYGWRGGFAPNHSGPRSYHPKEHTQSSSWISNSLAAGAGFLGGYFLGSRDREPMHRTSQSRLYPDLGGVGDETTYDSHTTTTTTHTSPHRPYEDDRDSYVATGFASTSRR
ncbi:Store-operated calcium entry-associated regulatory factor [Clonorchis sinensis]|uniref:Store-operated calcium entry-associated regulatory factor n=1 Tax=Clonorchis sinensis TaxID=79923 RepID=A0A8T1MHZ8_CLOSI|nr:Store-operated calcium entry-associated regulatory factor [Clonorchis sinensis]